MKHRTVSALAALPLLLLASACGGERTAEDDATAAGVMCEDSVREELDLGESAQFDDSPDVEVTSAESPRTYEIAGSVDVDGTATDYVCTISTSDQGDTWTMEGVEITG
ncbi:hypothetical protein HDA32_000006 [Spinactinospora alkalitolerans]|uniref:Uncharacterized protein n=1 Tax=Spinactinospora alkalitolerans TaxID=687207 RepID=A0A852TKZ7_9ACTN|nr:hypothetical protein [Spinactinospora alkalitolerans]NYE44886.1 hypothetical protein [Spinactinospora alkalitolerans]